MRSPTKAETRYTPRHARRLRHRLFGPTAAVLCGFAILAVSFCLPALRAHPTGDFGTVDTIPPLTQSARHTTIAGGQPAWLDLPTIHVHAHIEKVVTTDGSLGVPDDPARVGWWTGSALAGSPAGSTVVDGHVDSATAGTGALFFLTRLTTGDAVAITTSAGRVVRYRVVGRRVYTKRRPLPADLFTTTGPARLVLITCGGSFDSATHSYRDNVVVFAVPVA